MKKKSRFIALSPTPECLCLAAMCRPEWDSLVIAGRHQIRRTLSEWVNAGIPVDQVLLLQSRVEEPDKVRELLRKLVAQGTRHITWFAPYGSESVERACAETPGVELVQDVTLAGAVAKRFRSTEGAALLRDLENQNPDLFDFLRYKISMCFMQVMDACHLAEAVDSIRPAGGRSFRLAYLSPADRASVEHFREADFPYLEGQSAPLMHLKERIRQIAPTDLSALILGETGTGKEYVAFYLHEFSPRRVKPFVALNCAGLEENFLRSELFGHVKGAFTGAVGDKQGLVEAADGGTLFLDEISEMPSNIQADLLRFLQTRRFRPLGGTREKKVNIRILAATQPRIEERLRKGEFRPDLYYRIAEVVLRAPSLCDIPEDIRRIIRHIVHRHTKLLPDEAMRDEVIAYFDAGRETLERWPWPGNTRELLSLIRRRLFLGDDVVSELRSRLDSLTAVPGSESGAVPLLSGEIHSGSQIRTLESVLRGYVNQVFDCRQKLGLSQKEIADRLGITVNTLKKHLRQHRD